MFDASSLAKTPYKKENWTAEQLTEFALCVDPDTGPQYFMSNFFYIQHSTQGKMLYQPFEYQKKLIDTYHNYRFSIAMMPRQSGKSTSAAGYLLWYAMFVPDSTVLIAAHKFDGAQEIMTRVRYAYELCPDHIRAGATNYNKGSIEFENGSRIVSATTTENTGRGMSISLLYCLDGDTSVVNIRNKKTLLEEEITLKNLYIRLVNPKQILTDNLAIIKNNTSHE
jgi:Terminase large subunit, T4likevirus-type, N-terminal